MVSSPLARTRQTAAHFGVDVDIDDRLIELDYGDWEGRRVRDVEPLEWVQWQGDLDFAPPGGESLRSVGFRVRAACAELAADAIDKTIVVVTHVSPLKAAVAWALGVGDETTWRLFVVPASISRVAVRPGGATSLHAFNERSHLEG